ncbi:F-box domain-containing protein [Caenorhabditis elegans]|uniref:F-box domain-containing protein n=1 Tax=Caenorhabditis elegans TaxID=6239 RepID=G5ECQ5_CAEEL|nr:F-box domain-containing protein [Caenorhabditis elegans]NP_492910.1 F-box domain-containing protein [Caenorhabditis elegans]CAA64362.1 pes-2 [Caenorhabditis elegans]CAA64363.1 pes-2 [Caenorhabditis elegans]CAB04484.1 F-box domain-containing protein [Caenorhabditis elegans]CAB04485.1 F-box domain-containing protein [Caenorhabditis elegans]|eukprot:NP_492909.1 Patterned Expression Site [Caenorhabditis elegans]
MPVKVLNFPSVVLQHFLVGLTSTELFELTQCSLKSKDRVRPYEKSNKTFRMAVDFQRNWVDIRGVYRFYVKELVDGKLPKTYGKMGVREFGDKKVQVELDENEKTINIFWPTTEKEDRTFAVMKVAEHFIYTLGLGEFESVTLGQENHAGRIIDWANEKNLNIANFTIGNVDKEHDDVDKVAEKLYSASFFKKVSANFKCLINPTEAFKPNEFLPGIPKNTNMIFFHGAHWMTIDTLKDFTACSVILYDCKFTNKDINEFIKLWKNKEFERIFYISINVPQGSGFKLTEVIAGLDGFGEIENDATTMKREDGKEIEVSVLDEKKQIRIVVD